MTKKDYQVIADVLHRFKRSGLTSGPKIKTMVEWLADEFAYVLEDNNPLFDEHKFRNAIFEDNDNDPLVCVYPNCNELQTADGEFCDKHYGVSLPELNENTIS